MQDGLIREIGAALDAAVSPGGGAPGITGGLGLAVSGGGDSVALMRAASVWAFGRGVRCAVATVDHGLRAESAGEARAVAEWASALGLPHETLHWSGWDGQGNLQAEARKARRALLSAWARREHLSAIALGHTMDDQAETVLMRLGRGAGVDGLSAMAARSSGEGMVWLRPMLGMRRAALRGWLASEGADWIDDPTNDDMRYDRVRVRYALGTLEDLGVKVAGLAAMAGRMRSARDALDQSAMALAAEATVWGLCGELTLALAPLRAAPAELARRVFRKALTEVSGAAYGPRAEAEARLLSDCLGLRLGGGRSLHGALIQPVGADHVALMREASAAPPLSPLPETEILWDGRFQITPVSAPAGAMLGALGESGAAALALLEREGRFRAPEGWRKAPRAARLSTPALWCSGVLAAAPLAGYGEGLAVRFARGADAGVLSCERGDRADRALIEPV